MSYCIHIVGSGALGTYLAHLVNNLGVLWTLVGRDRTPVYREFVDETGQIFKLSGNEDKLPPPDLVFFAVKAYDLEAAIVETLPTLSQNTTLISLSNGAVETLLQKIALREKKHFWRLGICKAGITQVGDKQFQIKSKGGEFTWGPCPGSIPREPNPVENFLTRSNKVFKFRDDILPAIRKKWLFNMTINTICAAEKLPNNGSILPKPELLKATFNESFQLGVELFGPWPEQADELFEETVNLIKATTNNENSMARDVRLHRRTEVDFLSGLAQNQDKYPTLIALSKKIQAATKM